MFTLREVPFTKLWVSLLSHRFRPNTLSGTLHLEMSAVPRVDLKKPAATSDKPDKPEEKGLGDDT